MTLDKLIFQKADIGSLDLIRSSVTFNKAQAKLYTCFLDIIEYNKKFDKYTSFFDYKINESKNSLIVKKTRINKILEKFNYHIDSDFTILELKSVDFKTLVDEALQKLDSIDVKCIKLFDSFNSYDRKYLYEDNKFKSSLKKFLDHNVTIQIISIMNDINSSKFFQDLLLYNQAITIKYLRHPVMSGAPLMFVLITDTNDTNYIFYFEEMVRWSVLSSVDDHIEFSHKFFSLLNLRFDYFFKAKSLEEKNLTIPIHIDTFSNSFIQSIEELINNICILLNKKDLSHDKIRIKTHELIHKLLLIRISFPKMHYSYKILNHTIKLLETILSLETNQNIQNTKTIIELLANAQIFDEINRKFLNETTKETMLLKKNTITNENIINVRQQLFNTKLNKHNLILEIFDNLPWNTKETITHSLNLILQDYNLLQKFVHSSLSQHSKSLVSEYENILLYKCIARIIMSFYEIKLPKKFPIELQEEEIKILQSLQFVNNDFQIRFEKSDFLNFH
jgi:hypothetical protein